MPNLIQVIHKKTPSQRHQLGAQNRSGKNLPQMYYHTAWKLYTVIIAVAARILNRSQKFVTQNAEMIANLFIVSSFKLPEIWI